MGCEAYQRGRGEERWRITVWNLQEKHRTAKAARGRTGGSKRRRSKEAVTRKKTRTRREKRRKRRKEGQGGEGEKDRFVMVGVRGRSLATECDDA